MEGQRVEVLELLRKIQRSAGDQRKIFLALYGILLFVPLALVVVALGRASLSGGLGAELEACFLRPVAATFGFFSAAFEAGRWGLMAATVLGLWFVAVAAGSFFGLAITRMAAIELTCERRAEVREALSFARRHFLWAFVAPAGLLLAAILLLGLAALAFSLGRASETLLAVAAPAALVLCLAAVVLVVGLVAGGVLAWPTIATEWSDAFDAITRVYGYSFSHSHRVLLYRVGAGLVLAGAALARGVRAAFGLLCLYLALMVGFGLERSKELVDAVLKEPAAGSPFPRTVAAWTLVACVAVLLTLAVARLAVYRIVLQQAVYLLLRLRIDRVPLHAIDGYRPDDSAYDPIAQGFELVEVEGEIPTEGTARGA
jgi:hypothetical protein